VNLHSCQRGSFRDPSGFIFVRNETIYRQVNLSYKENFNYLKNTGLLDSLQKKRLLVSHEEVNMAAELSDAYLIIKPESIPFISYPYEWCFSQLKDAALLTLDVLQEALQHDMVLKDASAYNIQFNGSKPVFIDTLSFERYTEGRPWVGYRQFCQHFLAPLALISYKDERLSRLLCVYIDGIPLDLAIKSLPFVAILNPGLFFHLYLHAWAQKKYSSKYVFQQKTSSPKASKKIGKRSLYGIIQNLQSTIKGLTWKKKETEWAEYYTFHLYSAAAFENKQNIVKEFLWKCTPNIVWDLGANDGTFSRLASAVGARVIAFDIDPVAVEKNYQTGKKESDDRILPLILDLTNPSPAIGWANKERQSITERGRADVVMALALIHHLAIANNVPLKEIARLFRSMGEWLILEFVPKDDTQVQRLLSSREDVFLEYNEKYFLRDFLESYALVDCRPITDSGRKLFLMKAK
jgi:hypothetical protein